MEPAAQPSDTHPRFVLSWTAYVGPLAVLVVALVAGIVFYHYTESLGFLAILFCLVAIVGTAYKVAMLHSTAIYTDDEGVCRFRGFLPWSKGSYRIKWRDIEKATYYPNFSSWLFKSYRIRVWKRFNGAGEIDQPHVRLGEDAARHINSLHEAKIAAEGPIEKVEAASGVATVR